jgi:hypothetical protein
MTARSSVWSLAGLLLVAGALCAVSSGADTKVPPRQESLDEQLQRLRRERVEVARLHYERLLKENGVWPAWDRHVEAAELLLVAELALASEPEGQIAILERHLGRLCALHNNFDATFRSGRIPISDLGLPSTYAVFDALLQLYDARKRQTLKPGTTP